MIIQVRGGLASQMFAYALGEAAKAKGISHVKVDFAGYLYGKRQHNGAEINAIFELPEYYSTGLKTKLIFSNKLYYRLIRWFVYKTKIIHQYRADVKGYRYDPDVFMMNKNTLVYQVWTSWKYFSEITDKIKQIYKFPEIEDGRNQCLARNIGVSESVAVHVRRGDYLISPVHNEVTDINYYKKAISTLEERNLSGKELKYFIFSNDVNWCRENLKMKNFTFVDWNTGADSYRDMQLMSLCKHQIIPNSAFSWWAAFLNENPEKIVICPARWTNPGFGVDLSDMIYPGWICIDN